MYEVDATRSISSPSSTRCSPMRRSIGCEAAFGGRRRAPRAPCAGPLRRRAWRPRQCRGHRHCDARGRRVAHGDPALVAPWSFRRSRTMAGCSPKAVSRCGEIELVPRPTLLKTGMEGWLRTFGRSFSTASRAQPDASGGRGGRIAAALAMRQQRHVDRRTISGFVSSPNAALDESRHTNAQFMDEAFDVRERTGAKSVGPFHKVCGMMQRKELRGLPRRRDFPIYRGLHAGFGSRGRSRICGSRQQSNCCVGCTRQDDKLISHLEIPINKTVAFGAY